jgi:hypothetical protein
MRKSNPPMVFTEGTEAAAKAASAPIVGLRFRLARISHGSLGLRKTRRRNQFFQVAMMTDDFYEVITEPSGRRKYFKRRKEIYFFVIRPLEGTAPQALRAEVSIFSTALRRPSVQRRRFVHTC